MKKILIFICIILFALPLFATNNCLDFDGTDDYVKTNSTFALPTSSGTFEGWVWAASGETNNSFWGNITSAQGQARGLRVNSDTVNDDIYFYGWSYDAIFTDAFIGMYDKWTHIALVINSTTSVSLYLNGVLIETKTPTGGSPSLQPVTDHFLIGDEQNTTAGTFKGKIDEVRIWNDVRTATEIRANMYKELAGTEADLVAYYKLNETTGTNADDSKSGGTNDGTLNYMTNNDWVTSSAFFGPKNCLDFDGTDDYVDCGNNASLQITGALTLEAWIYLTAEQTWDGIISKSYYQAAEGYTNTSYTFKFHDDTETFEFWITSDGTEAGRKITYSATPLSINTWYHVAAVYKPSEYSRIYINGILDGEETSTIPAAIYNSPRPVGIGYDYGTESTSSFFQGKIDEVRIWNDARTAEEIRENMCRTLIGNEANLVAYYRFDQEPTSGQATLYDITSNANHGTLTSMDATTDWVECTAFDTWIGWFSSSWSEAKNWSRGLPSSTDNVGIHFWTLGHHPTISSISYTKTLVIGLAANLTLNSGLQISGNLFELGNLTHNNQTVTFAGSSSQYLVGSLDFYDLTINNTHASNKVSAWWTTSLSVSNDLTINDGIFYSKSDYTNVNIAPQGTLELSGDITVSGNWDNDGTFTHNNHKVTFDGSSGQTIQGDNSTTFYDLTINNSTGVTFSNANTVNNTFTLTNGNLTTTTSNLLTLGAAATVSGGSDASFVNGPVVNAWATSTLTKKFPLGKGSAYRPLEITLTSPSSPAMRAEIFNANAGGSSSLARISTVRYYETSVTTGSVGNIATAKITYGSDDGVSDHTTLVVARSTSKTGIYNSLGRTASDASSVTSSTYDPTELGDFLLLGSTSSDNTLPVVLSSFTAQFIENTPTLYWTTQSETDNMGWFVYRNEENDFSTSEKISEFIEGHGTTTQQQSYIYEDRTQNPEVGDTYYYWLESVDYSGIVNHYDKVAILTIPEQPEPGSGLIPEPERYGLLQNEPNPFIESTKISFNLSSTAKVELNIYNLKGQLVKSLYSGVASSKTLDWNGKDNDGKTLSAGVYLYKLLLNGKTAETKKLILIK